MGNLPPQARGSRWTAGASALRPPLTTKDNCRRPAGLMPRALASHGRRPKLNQSVLVRHFDLKFEQPRFIFVDVSSRTGQSVSTRAAMPVRGNLGTAGNGKKPISFDQRTRGTAAWCPGPRPLYLHQSPPPVKASLSKRRIASGLDGRGSSWRSIQASRAAS